MMYLEQGSPLNSRTPTVGRNYDKLPQGPTSLSSSASTSTSYETLPSISIYEDTQSLPQYPIDDDSVAVPEYPTFSDSKALSHGNLYGDQDTQMQPQYTKSTQNQYVTLERGRDEGHVNVEIDTDSLDSDPFTVFSQTGFDNQRLISKKDVGSNPADEIPLDTIYSNRHLLMHVGDSGSNPTHGISRSTLRTPPRDFPQRLISHNEDTGSNPSIANSMDKGSQCMLYDVHPRFRQRANSGVVLPSRTHDNLPPRQK